MRNMLIIFILFFASSAVAATDIIATYKYQDGNMLTIVTRDKDHVRMDTSATSYMLLKGDKVYSVSQDDSGQWMVMDLGQMAAAASSSSFTSLFGGGEQVVQEKEYSANYEKTGRKEKIAGYTGVVYNAEVKEDDEIIRRDEVVLCSHSDIKKINDGWSAIAAKMSENMGQEMAKSIEQATKEAKAAGYGGMLRYGDEMKLQSLKKMNLNVSYYDIPSGAQYVEMGQMPNSQQQPTYDEQQQIYDQQQQEQDMQQQYEQQQGYQDQGQQEVYNEQEQQNQAGQVLEQDAQDAGTAAHDEAKDATNDKVREGVRTLFDSLFN
jgi:hypothetical protein